MADPQIITTLTRKRDEIEAAIKAYEKKIALAKRDLSSVSATMRLFKLDGDPSEFPTYIDTLRLLLFVISSAVRAIACAQRHGVSVPTMAS